MDNAGSIWRMCLMTSSMVHSEGSVDPALWLIRGSVVELAVKKKYRF